MPWPKVFSLLDSKANGRARRCRPDAPDGYPARPVMTQSEAASHLASHGA